MFKTELNCEEESVLIQMLEEKSKSRSEILLEINYCSQNTEDKDNINLLKGLFSKIKNTSDYEFNEYIKLLLEA